MRKIMAACVVVLALGSVPFASVAHEDEADAAVPLSDVPELGQGDLYLDAETMAIWQESNGDPGLQTQPHQHDETTVPPDTQVFPPAGDLPAPPEVPEPPAPPAV